MSLTMARSPPSLLTPMRNALFSSIHRRGLRTGIAFLLLALLTLQVQVAIASCVMTAPAHAGHAEHAAMMIANAGAEVAMAPCCPPDESAAASCAERCRQSVGAVPSSDDKLHVVAAFDLSAGVDVPRPLPLVTPPAAAVVRHAAGPPQYLRYLRLLN